MALGKRKHEQQELWVATTELPKSPGHPFYQKLNQLLAKAQFDEYVEKLCEPHYAGQVGRPSIPPGVYFRMLLIGHFEGIASQRGIAWRVSDSRSLSQFLGFGATDETPDHSSLTRTHQRLPHEVHAAMFAFVLKLADEAGLISGKTVAIDSTTLEANAAMKTIVRRDTGETWKEYLRRLAEEAGQKDLSTAALINFDKKRENKTVSNKEWKSSTDEEGRIARMKDGTTHVAYKAEHVIDLKSEIVLAAEIHDADRGDAETGPESLVEAQRNLMRAGSEANIEEAAADKGYHSAEAVATLQETLGIRTYIPEPKRKGKTDWTNKTPQERKAIMANRQRVKRAKGKKLQRLRSERVERSFAHVCETGGARRCWLRGKQKVSKRYLIQVAARNLATIMRKLFKMGTARGQQDLRSLILLAQFVVRAILKRLDATPFGKSTDCETPPRTCRRPITCRENVILVKKRAFSTG